MDNNPATNLKIIIEIYTVHKRNDFTYSLIQTKKRNASLYDPEE